MFPLTVRIRIPKLIFRASEHGYNIHNLYSKCEEYADSYYHCIMVVRGSVEKEKGVESSLFGAYVDLVPSVLPSNPNTFQGQSDCFVFTFSPHPKKFSSSNSNDRYCLFKNEYFTIGSGGEGPALRIDESLTSGKSYDCETFGSTCLTDGVGFKANEFQVEDFELYLI